MCFFRLWDKDTTTSWMFFLCFFFFAAWFPDPRHSLWNNQSKSSLWVRWVTSAHLRLCFFLLNEEISASDQRSSNRGNTQFGAQRRGNIYYFTLRAHQGCTHFLHLHLRTRLISKKKTQKSFNVGKYNNMTTGILLKDTSVEHFYVCILVHWIIHWTDYCKKTFFFLQNKTLVLKLMQHMCLKVKKLRTQHTMSEIWKGKNGNNDPPEDVTSSTFLARKYM